MVGAEVCDCHQQASKHGHTGKFQGIIWPAEEHEAQHSEQQTAAAAAAAAGPRMNVCQYNNRWRSNIQTSVSAADDHARAGEYVNTSSCMRVCEYENIPSCLQVQYD